jgi:hypothetical protein
LHGEPALGITPGVNDTPTGSRTSFSHRVVFTALAISFLAAFGVGLFMYFGYIRYERIAARHLPRDTELAVRMDLEKVVMFEPFHAHVLPLFNDVSPGADPHMRPRLTRLEHWARLELAVDIREVVFAKGPAERDYAVVIGGRFARSGILDGVQKALAEEGHHATLRREGRLLCLPAGCLGQADDGALVLATSEARAFDALEPNQRYAELGLSLDGPGGVAVTAAGLERASAVNGAGDRRAGRLFGEVMLGERFELTGKVERPAAEVEATLKAAKAGLSATASSPEELIRLGLERAEITPSGTDSTQFRTFWERAEAERAGTELARRVRNWSGLEPVAPQTPVRR